ncbi:VOC family protein [Rubellimicrobium roseum]|uniref:VOC family protein n=1 Tax=Rubellimicrobium roseum TaxID=687525 RepID=A0A5C4N9Q0_9RHOB|nr:VOC family protein [Rubellimicrobium roseum]TNC63990.1 VOC family protein [Rubellimicrobium roseum]
MNGISTIAHVALKVRDLDRSLDFYVNKLGFAEMMRLDKPDGRPGVWLVYLRITDTQYLELFPDGEGERAPGWNDTAINHICLGVDEIDATLAHLEKVGIPLLLPKKQAVDGNWQAWIEDPDGNRIELMQMMPGSLQEQAIDRLKREAQAQAKKGVGDR